MARRSTPADAARRGAAHVARAKSKSRSKSGASRAAVLLTLLSLLVIVVAGGLYWTKSQLAPENASDHTLRPIDVPEGANVPTLAELLSKANLVRSPLSVTLAARLDKQAASHLKAGIYLIAPSESPDDMLKQIAAGSAFGERVVIPEGFTVRQIVARLAEHHMGDPAELTRLALTQGRTFHGPDGFTPPSDNLEGYLLPQTYLFRPNITSRQILELMVRQFDVEVVMKHPEVRDWRKPVIVASMVEREAKIDMDRPIIAAVLDNRLKIHMPLQVDATVEYALPEHKARLFYSDLKTPSPYNTYLHRGLPPGPICNPGMLSIEAALKPAPVDYLYYVAAPDGSHKFSRTLAEQDRNIAAVRNNAARG